MQVKKLSIHLPINTEKSIMASLNQILKDVLLLQDSVTVPNFGTFETTYQSAQLDEKTGIIYPPTKLVSFNAVLTEDKKNILLDYLTKNLGLDQDAAQKLITDFISQTEEKLKEKSNVVIDEVGILYKDDAGIVGLKSIPSNLSIDNYGMEQVEVEAVSGNQRAATSKGKTVTTTKTTKTTTVKTTATAATAKTDAKPKETEKKKDNKLKILLIILPIIALLAVLFFLFKDKLFGQKQTNKPAQIEQAQPSTPTVDVTGPEPEVDVDAADPDGKILSDAGFRHVTPIFLGDEYKKYYLVAGSFTTKANAKKRKNELKAENIDSDILSIGTQHRVIVGQSDSAADIVKQYKAITENHPSLDYWLLKNSR